MDVIEGVRKRGISDLLPWVCFALRLGLAALFIYGGATKLVDPKAFARLLSHYDLVPDVLLPVVAVGLPILEVAAGMGLVFEVRGSLALTTGLLVLFVIVLWYGVVKGLDVDCGCFGAGEIAALDGLKKAFYRDLGLLGVAALLFVTRRMGLRVDVLVWNRQIKRRMKNEEKL